MALLIASSSESDVLSLLVENVVDNEETTTDGPSMPHVVSPANTLGSLDSQEHSTGKDDIKYPQELPVSPNYPPTIYPPVVPATPLAQSDDRMEVDPTPGPSRSSSRTRSCRKLQGEGGRGEEVNDRDSGAEGVIGAEETTADPRDTRISSSPHLENLDAQSPMNEQDDIMGFPLPPNYPPIIYPAAAAPESTPSLEQDDRMVVDPEPEPSRASSQTASGEETDGDNGDEDIDEDEYASSEVSAGGDLMEDLEDALGGDFDFKGSYYYGSPAPGAPNPCLNIEGLGPVGLPLSPRDAKSIIECSTQAPFGHRDRTIVDKEVRDTWEIEPARVKFDNPAWANFVQTTAFNTVWHALGVAPFSHPPRCELYKLLLYETGSHFLSHQDTEKADGMFATIIIVLPSPYTGGEVHLSHGSSTTVLDMAPISLLSTTILAWYTDVKHEVKPITSGYRLALSYNLIHTSPGVPLPVLPDTSRALLGLRNVLRKWRKGGYDDEPQMVAYLLDHQYSAANLQLGAKALKGKDLHQITNLKSVADELGYMVCLGALSYHVVGDAEDCGYGYRGSWKRGRYHDYGDSDEDEDATMGEILEKTLTIQNLVDLDGNLILSSSQTLSLEEDNLIPKDPFEDLEPDDKEYEGYMGNHAGSIEYWYRRTVLVLLSEDNAPGILFAAGGVNYALQRLKQSNSPSPTADDVKMANLVIDRLNPTDKTTVISMAHYALKWKDVNMWKTVIKKGGSLISTFGADKVVSAMKIFSFEGVRDSFEELLSKTTRLSERLDFIHAVPPQASPEESDVIREWAQDRVKLAFASFNKPTVEDIPALIAVARVRGAPFLVKEILPQLVKNTSVFTFCISLVKSLHENKKSILERSQPTSNEIQEDTSEDVKAFDHLVDQCLNTSVMQWESVVAQPAAYPYHGNPSPKESKVTRVVDLVEVCLLTGHMAPCKKLFVLLLKVQGATAQKFQMLYNPLIPRLRELLRTKNIDICSSPFADLLQLFVGTYLRDILGAQPRNTRTKVRKIGCGCGDCNMVDSFLSSTTSTPQLFRYPQVRRTHVERQLSAAPDLVSFQTIRSGSPHGIQVTKRPEIVAAQQWGTRVAQTNAFLRSIGDDDVLSRLMGNRYGDVMKALQGSQQFILTVGDATTSTVAGSRPAAVASQAPALLTANAASSSGLTVPRTLAPSVPTAGKKRKKGLPISGPVIDLTGDDSS